MTVRKTLKTALSARTLKLATSIGAALLVASCATGSLEQPQISGATPSGPELADPLLAEQAAEQEWQSVAASEALAAAGSQPLISPPGALAASKERKIALRKLAARSIRTDAPDEYTVVKGDTLWDISGRFLSRPWLWPEIWQVNPQIENPHLIYPGDRIALTYVDGSPRLQLIRASSNPGDAPVGSIPTELIEQFLVKPLVVTEADILSAPYVAASQEGHLIATNGIHIYARGDISGSRFSIYRPGKRLIDPDTEELLGYEAIHVSNASLVSAGDPSKLVITNSYRETLKGDRLLAVEKDLPAHFQPRAATTTTPGKIISLVDAVSRAGKNQIVVMNMGANDGVQAGDTFSVRTNERIIRDDIDQSRSEFFTVEGDESGTVMVFRTFDNVSYALIMSSAREVKLYDKVVSTANQL